MKKNTQDRIDEIKRNGYPLDFGDVFNHAFENYKKIALYGGLVIFVFFILLSIVAFGVLIAIFGGATILDFLKPENLKPENFNLNTLLIFSGISVLTSCVLSPFPAGLIKMAFCAERDQEFHVSTMFVYYKAPYFKELFIATFLVSVTSSLISAIINYIQIPVIEYVVAIIITLFTMLMMPLIIFGNLKAVEAIETSILIVLKQPLVLLGLLIVGSVGTLVGFIGCCIGIFFTLPFMYSLYYSIYNEIFGFESKTEDEEKI